MGLNFGAKQSNLDDLDREIVNRQSDIYNKFSIREDRVN